MNEDKIAEMVKREVAEALGRSAGDLREETRLGKDLGAESIDRIDLTFRFEKALGKPLSEQEIFRSNRPDGDVSMGDIVRALASLVS